MYYAIDGYRCQSLFGACEVVLNMDTMLRCKQILQEKMTHQVPAVISDAGEKE